MHFLAFSALKPRPFYETPPILLLAPRVHLIMPLVRDKSIRKLKMLKKRKKRKLNEEAIVISNPDVEGEGTQVEEEATKEEKVDDVIGKLYN